MIPLAFALLALLAQAPSTLPDRISAASLRGRVSFLASDALEGRDTPSRGLDVAAAYISSEFRRAGLQTAAAGDYYQVAPYVAVSDRPDGLQFSVSGAGEAARSVSAERISISSFHGVHLVNEPIFKWAPNVPVSGSLAGRILMLRAPSDPSTIRKLSLSRPDAIVQLVRRPGGTDWRGARLVPMSLDLAAGPAIISVPETDVEATFDRLPNGSTNGRATLQIADPVVRPERLLNVIGFLRGSDPKLRDEYVLVSAHYDHLGVRPGSEKDRIYNGANDNASGVATVLELAHAFAREDPAPKRTLVFICFFGEEKGLFGSNWYVQHPLFPLAHTVMDFNFEQLGEPESAEGLPAGSLGVTGFDFSDVPRIIEADLAEAGVKLRDARHNDDYFDRSDNFPFAQAGVLAHTFVAALDFPDYHRTSDEWPKLDYDNMASLGRGLSLAIRDVADRTDSPIWNDQSKKTEAYRNAWRATHP